MFHSIVMSVTRSNALFASKDSLMTDLSDGGDSVVSTRCLLPDVSSFTGFGVSVSDHS